MRTFASSYGRSCRRPRLGREWCCGFRMRRLLVSGMLSGGRELANRPVVVDVPRGRGHVLLFANNPIWRNATQGSYFLLSMRC